MRCLNHALAIAFLPVLAVPTSAEAKQSYEVRSSGTKIVLPVEKSPDFVIAILANARQRVQLVVKRRSSTTEYSTKGSVSAHSIKADFGGLGRVEVRLHLVRRPPASPHVGRCKGPASLYQEGTYVGSIKFSGQGGVPDISVARGHVYYEQKFRQVCARRRQSGEKDKRTTTRPAEAGILTIEGRAQGRTVFFRAFNLASIRNPMRSAGFLALAVHERLEWTRITQRISVSINHDSFAMGPRGMTDEIVEVAPPEPFAGNARYTRGPDASASWTGDLTIDLPDGTSLPLVDRGLTADFCRGILIDKLRQCLNRSGPRLPAGLASAASPG